VSTSEVTELIHQLQSGAMNLEQVAERFGRRTWARARRPQPENDEERAEQLDPGLPVAGSIDDVTAAYDRGELTVTQYQVLSEAVAESIRCEVCRREQRKHAG